MSSLKKLFIGDFLVCDHKLNKWLFIARFEMEALPTRFLSDCKSFLFLFLLFCILLTVLMKNVK